MSDAAAIYDALTDSERKDREAMLRSLGLKPPKPDASVIRFDHPVRKLRSEIAELRLGYERERATAAELRAKQNEHDFILSRLRVENAGPVGPAGPMGRDGHEGRPGPRGERGERGPPAASIAAWEPNGERFQITPVYSDGTRGPPLSLRSLFEAYDSAAEDDDG
jgi:hypothetical protein